MPERHNDAEIKYHFVEFTISIPAKGLNREQLLAFARNSLREDSHDILKDICRYGGKVAETIDLYEAVDYGLIE